MQSVKRSAELSVVLIQPSAFTVSREPDALPRTVLQSNSEQDASDVLIIFY